MDHLRVSTRNFCEDFCSVFPEDREPKPTVFLTNLLSQYLGFQYSFNRYKPLKPADQNTVKRENKNSARQRAIAFFCLTSLLLISLIHPLSISASH